MRSNWKKKRQIELVRHLNHVLVGIMFLLMMGIMCSWDGRDIAEGEPCVIIVSVLYLLVYIYTLWKRSNSEL